MYSLYLDTATRFLCIGVAQDNRFIYKMQVEALKKQSELTIPELEKCFNTLHLTLKDIQEIIITIGPGSFTGVRIALCIAKVIASLQNIPLRVISTLKAYAGMGKKIVLIDAKANRAYTGIYQDGQEMEKEAILTLEEVKEKMQQYVDFEIVNDTFLVEKESQLIDILENMSLFSSSLAEVENVDALVPFYFKDR